MNRLFLAAPLPDGVREAIRSALAASQLDGLPGRPVPAENWHLTLRFLGDTLPDAVSRLVAELAAAELGTSLQIAFGALGAFPRAERARVLWMGIESGAAELGALADELERCARRAGFPAEQRPFSPHLTLSRLRPPENVAPLLAKPMAATIPAAVRDVVLYRSHLGGGHPRYEAIARVPLG